MAIDEQFIYEELSSLFVLPSKRWLRKLSEGTTVTDGSLDLSYLKKRTLNLSEREKVTLIFDEIYTAQRIEYSGGRFIGLNDDNKPAKIIYGTVMLIEVQGHCLHESCDVLHRTATKKRI